MGHHDTSFTAAADQLRATLSAAGITPSGRFTTPFGTLYEIPLTSVGSPFEPVTADAAQPVGDIVAAGPSADDDSSPHDAAADETGLPSFFEFLAAIGDTVAQETEKAKLQEARQTAAGANFDFASVIEELALTTNRLADDMTRCGLFNVAKGVREAAHSLTDAAEGARNEGEELLEAAMDTAIGA